MGHDNFVWWIGVIEDRLDPLNLGRCRVRIFGSHTDNLQQIPTDTLPWAIPLYPVNSSKSYSSPLEGDYVFGFFMDGLSSQAPAILGVFPAIIQNANPPAGVGFSSKAKLTNSTISESELVTPVVAADTPGMQLIRSGEPTTPKLAYDIVGTGVEKSNNSRVHVCDIANQLKFSIAIQKLEAYGVFTTIRTTIETLTSSIAASPIATGIAEAIKVIRAYVKMIQKGVDFINEVVLEIARFMKYLKDMIAYILSLPAQLAAMLNQCLQELYNSLSNTLSISGSTGILSEVQGLITDVSKVATTATALQSNATNLLSTNSFGKA